MERNTFFYSPADMIREMKREQKMRRKVWRQRSGGGGKFISSEHQKQYDCLEEIIFLFEKLGEKRVELLQLRIVDELRAQQKLDFGKESG